MKLPRPRITVRRLMAAVAVVALVIVGSIEGGRLIWLRNSYLKSAQIFRSQEATCRAGSKLSDEEWVAESKRIARLNRASPKSPRGLPLKPDLYRRLTPYFESMRLKYERAARLPWLPVEPDPPSRLDYVE